MERLKLETIENIIKTHRTVVEVLENENIDDDYDLSLDKCIIYGMEELKQYRIAEEQGLLLRLPCKIGRKVFYVQKCLAPSCKECKGFLRVDNCYCQYKARIFEQEFDYRHLKAFGKSVFLTKEEAEQALAKMKEV